MIFLFINVISVTSTPEDDDMYKPKRMERPKDDGKWRGKDVRDYNDADVEKLFDQWEVGFSFEIVSLSDWLFMHSSVDTDAAVFSGRTL